MPYLTSIRSRTRTGTPFRRLDQPIGLTRRTRGRDLLATVAFERPRGRELAELVPDHVFLHEHLDELVSVVHFERVPDELGDDRARTAPRPDRPVSYTHLRAHET